MKAVLLGAAFALTAGFLLGQVMKPDLLTDTRPSGLQPLASPDGASSGPFYPDANVITYPGKVPDYVIGLDVTHPKPAPVIHDEAVAEEAPMPQADGTTELTHAAALVEPPRERVADPSLDGAAAHDAGSSGVDADVVVPKEFGWSG